MHTPGPWDVTFSQVDENVYRLLDAGGNYPANTDLNTKRNNARLMAAAPDLLETLMDIAALFKHEPWKTETEKRIESIANSAIARATGES